MTYIVSSGALNSTHSLTLTQYFCTTSVSIKSLAIFIVVDGKFRAA